MHRRLTLVALTGVARDLACCVNSSLGFSALDGLASADDAATCFATFFVHSFAASAFMATGTFLVGSGPALLTGNLPNLLC